MISVSHNFTKFSLNTIDSLESSSSIEEIVITAIGTFGVKNNIKSAVLFSEVVSLVDCRNIVKIDPLNIPNIFYDVPVESKSDIDVSTDSFDNNRRLLIKPNITSASLLFKASFEDLN